MAYTQPKLPFPYDALEPYIDKETMEIHYGKHHTAYCKKFNDAVAGTKYDKKDLFDILKDIENVDEKIRTVVRNNGGGAWNHSFFWSVLCSKKESGQPGKNTSKIINDSFGSYSEFKKRFSDAATAVFGSGWAWLVLNNSRKLEIVKTANQDSTISRGLKPILVIDVWEHTYYLKYRNLRPDFIEAFFNIINWKQVEEYINS